MKELFYTGSVFRGGKSLLRTFEVYSVEDHLEWGLTQGMFSKVDLEDFEYLKLITWNATKATNSTGYYVSGGGTNKNSAFKMHQYLAGIHRKSVGFEVDHKNRDALDNRKYNLRLATRHQQQLNLTRTRFLSSEGRGFHGVRLNRNKTRFQAWYTDKNNKWKNVGMFSDVESAARARDKAVYQHFLHHNPLKGVVCRGITSEPTINFINFNFPEELFYTGENLTND